jgi:hypothetical protein
LDLVVPAHKEWGGTPYKLDPIFDGTNNVWSNHSVAPEEMYIETVRDLGASLELILDLKQSNERLSRELDDIRRSASWRMMAIPRLLARRMRGLASDAPWTGNPRRILGAGAKWLARPFSRRIR